MLRTNRVILGSEIGPEDAQQVARWLALIFPDVLSRPAQDVGDLSLGKGPFLRQNADCVANQIKGKDARRSG